MATYTSNYNLGKPDSSDPFGNFRQLFNDNMDIIDTIGGGSGGSSVSWNQLQVSGDKIAEITISGAKTNIFAPNSQTFSIAVSRTNIDSGETYPTIFGKIKKFFADLKTVAFSGSYNDLSDKPTIPTKTSDLTNDEGYTATSWNQIENSGTKIAEITIGGTSQDVYAPSASAGSTVAWNQLQVTGDKIAEITISGVKTDVISHSIAVSQIQSTGKHIADITIDGVKTELFAPHGTTFSALIIISDETGNTITASKGSDAYIATETSTGTYEVSVDSVGTWTISNGTETGTVVVSSSQTYYFSFTPEGSTVTPTDDVTIWIKCGSRTENYTTLNEVLADTTCLSALLSNDNANDYLVRSTTFAPYICSDSNAMSYIGLNNYCANTLLDDATWVVAIGNSTYFESVLNAKIPAMTSNTAPSGIVSGDNIWRQYPNLHYPFSGKYQAIMTNTTSSASVYYDFGKTIKACKYRVSQATNTLPPSRSEYVKLAAYGNSETYIPIPDSQMYLTQSNYDNTIIFTPTEGHKFQIYFWGSSDNQMYVRVIQIWGRVDV